MVTDSDNANVWAFLLLLSVLLNPLPKVENTYIIFCLNTFFSHVSSSAQRKGSHAIPQTAECTDCTGLPQTPAGMTRQIKVFEHIKPLGT